MKASEIINDLGVDTSVTRTPRFAGYARPGLADTDKFNMHAFSSNLHSFRTPDNFDPTRSANLLETSQPPFSVSTIISNMKNALSMSFIYSLAERQGLSPIGSCSYIGPPLPGDSTSLRNLIRTDQSNTNTSMTSVLIQWYPSGTLTTSISQRLTAGIQRVSDNLVDGSKIQEFVPTSKVLLSPSGRVVQYLGMLEINPNNSLNSAAKALHSRLDHVVKTKQLIAEYLALLGMHVKEEDKWVQLQHIEGTYRIGQSPRSNSSPGSFLWPAKFCFCMAETLVHEEILNEKNVNQDTEKDPLVRAESWYVAKASREAAVEAKRKDDELKAQRLQEAKEIEAEETLSDFVPRSTQYLSTQDASGIYPTPPDGLRSQAVSTSMTAESQGLASEFIDREIMNEERNELLIESPFAVPLGHDTTSRGYQGTDDVDLFGELDSGLFAANGLTEADFNFFDEPSIDGEISVHGELESASAEIGKDENAESGERSDGGRWYNNAAGGISCGTRVGDFLTSEDIRTEEGKKFLYHN